MNFSMSERSSTNVQSCILFATADWDEHYWTNKQHCALTLAELGIKVLYIESIGLRSPKVRSIRDWKRLLRRFYKGFISFIFGAREISPNVYVLSPLAIPGAYRNEYISRINGLILSCLTSKATRQLGFTDAIIWTYHPFMLNVINNLSISTLLYHCVDNLAAMPNIDASSFKIAEKNLLLRADLVFATAPSLAKYCLTFNPNTYYLSNAVDLEHFGRAQKSGAIPVELHSIPGPRLCYHGVLSDFKIDFQLLLDSALMKTEWSWILIGEEPEGQKNPIVAELRELKNVYFLGYKPYAALPEYLRGMNVGLLPSLINNYTRGMFPLKYYEFLAAGLPVASTPLDFLSHSTGGVAFGDGVNKFIDAIDYQLKRGRLSSSDIDTYIGDNTWRKRCLKMLEKIQPLGNPKIW